MRFLADVGLVAIVSLALSITLRSPVAPASACVGGGLSLEDAATSARVILLGQVVDAGDAVNHAPTLTPIPTHTKAPRFSTPWGTPVSPPLAPRTPLPAPPINLVGVRATFRLEDVYVGERVAEYVAGAESRAYLEEAMRKWEAGYPSVTDCALDAFVPRYTPGGQYLLFIRSQDAGPDYVSTAYRIKSDQIEFDDPGLWGANTGFLVLSERRTYELFFRGVAADDLQTQIFITADRVPLTSVLRAIAYLRNDPRIYPPDTGSAGLLPAGGAR